jgi:hypothetical protein
MAPWIGTIVAVFALQGILSATGLFERRWGQYVSVAITLPLIVGGIVWTFRRFQHKRPLLQIDLGSHEFSVRNPTRGQVVSRVPMAAIGGTRAMCRIVMKGATLEHAVLQIHMPGHPDLTVGVYDRTGPPRIPARCGRDEKTTPETLPRLGCRDGRPTDPEAIMPRSAPSTGSREQGPAPWATRGSAPASSPSIAPAPSMDHGVPDPGGSHRSHVHAFGQAPELAHVGVNGAQPTRGLVGKPGRLGGLGDGECLLTRAVPRAELPQVVYDGQRQVIQAHGLMMTCASQRSSFRASGRRR